MKEAIAIANSYAEALEKGESPEKIKEQNFEERMQEILVKFDKLPEDEKKKARDKYNKELLKALERSEAAFAIRERARSERVRISPSGPGR
jgi:hypothetical protein